MQLRYYQYPDKPSKFTEDLQSFYGQNPQHGDDPEQEGVSQDEQDLAARQLDEQKNQSRGQQIRDSVKELALDKAKTAAKQQVKKIASKSIVQFLFFTPPGWWILGTIAVVIIIIGLILTMITAIAQVCDPSASKNGGVIERYITREIQYASEFADFFGYDDYAICKDMGNLAGMFNGGASGGGGASGDIPPTPGGPPGAVLTDAEARAQLTAAGITVNAGEPRTSLEGVRQAVIDEIINFAYLCGSPLSPPPNQNRCGVVVTGGTEARGGHASGPCSHLSGNKIDIRTVSTVNTYISSTYKLTGSRSDGTKIYTSPGGVEYANEGDHWDIGGIGC